MCAVKSLCVTPLEKRTEKQVKIFDSCGNTELFGLEKPFKIIKPNHELLIFRLEMLHSQMKGNGAGTGEMRAPDTVPAFHTFCFLCFFSGDH